MAPARHLGVEPTGAGFKRPSGAMPPPIGASMATSEALRVAPELEHSPLLAAREWLDQVAIVGLERSWTWRQVHRASIELAERLRHASAVCNLCNSRLNFLVTWLAALRCRTPMVLPPSGGHADLAGVLQSTPRPVIVVDHEKAIQPGWRGSADCLVAPSTWPSAKAGATDPTWLPDWHCTAALLYTSGSTGAPEPHPKTLLQLVSGALALGERLAQDVAGGLSAMRRLVCSVPPQHMFGFEASVMFPLVHGIPVSEGRPAVAGRRAAGVCWFARIGMDHHALAYARPGAIGRSTAQLHAGAGLDDAADTTVGAADGKPRRRAGPRNLRLDRDGRPCDAVLRPRHKLAPGARRPGGGDARRHPVLGRPLLVTRALAR